MDDTYRYSYEIMSLEVKRKGKIVKFMISYVKFKKKPLDSISAGASQILGC